MRLTKIAVSLTLVGSLGAVSLPADIAKGKKVYMKRLKTACGFTGDKFARKHTQDEWEALYKEGKLKEEALRLCPGAKLRSKDIRHLFDFVYEFASDSGKTPSC